MSRQYSDGQIHADYWYDRLMPPVAFEDSKAIQKIQKNYRLLGIRSKVHTNSQLPADLNRLNRLWICVPRIPQAMKRLSEYGETARFAFERPKRNQDATLIWTNYRNERIRIRSPLRKYIKEQREASNCKGEWNSHLPRLFGKDYAIIARFANTDHVHADGSYSMDYFLAGIRGLGTWGAAWFLDRRYQQLKTWSLDSPLQVLLEVSFRDGNISDVVDVSDKPKEYFEKQNSISVIRSEIHETIHGGPPT